MSMSDIHRYYTGVGSRSTPPEICERLTELAEQLSLRGYTLRSGGAVGADRAFEEGSKLSQVFLAGHADGDQAALALAASIHPAWHRCKPYVKLLHARNCYQVLGRTLNEPSEFVICWTPGGEDTGGTRTAILLARGKGIPVYNLGRDGEYDRLLLEVFGETA